MATKKKTPDITNEAHHILIAFLLEIVILIIAVEIAAFSDAAANLILLLIAGLWLLWLVMHPDITTAINKKIQAGMTI